MKKSLLAITLISSFAFAEFETKALVGISSAEIDGENYIATYVDTDNYFSKEKGVIGFVEIRWLNLKTFEYHPTENTLIKDYGR